MVLLIYFRSVMQLFKCIPYAMALVSIVICYAIITKSTDVNLTDKYVCRIYVLIFCPTFVIVRRHKMCLKGNNRSLMHH